MADDALIKERVKRWVGTLPLAERTKPTVFTMNGNVFTPNQVLEEIEKDTPMGKVFKAAEAKLLEHSLQKKRQVGL